MTMSDTLGPIPDICHGHHGRCPCKIILSGVKFSRLNAKHYIVYYFLGIFVYFWVYLTQEMFSLDIFRYFLVFFECIDVLIFQKHFGTLLNIAEHFGALWNILEHYGTLRNILEHCGALWKLRCENCVVEIVLWKLRCGM